MSQKDLGNLLAAATTLLRHENDTIAAGDFDQAPQFAPRKAAALAELEAAAPALEQALAEGGEGSAALRDKVAAFQEVMERNARLTRAAARAAGDLVEELSRIRDRHGLKGVYGESGEVRGDVASPLGTSFDTSV